MEEQERQKLQELIDLLGSYRGRHTELITVYAPQGSNINQVANQVVSEQSTAQNIKSKTTRTNVIDALERIIRHLKLYKKIPDNGLAIFCGNISKNEGQPDIQIWAIEPPQPLKTKFYRCDQTFVLEPLKEMLKSIDVYGLLVIDRREATIGILEGKSITMLKRFTSGVPGKFKTGGQCLDKNVLVETNSTTKLKDLKLNDRVKSYNFKNNKITKTNIKDIWEVKKKEIILIKTKEKKIKASKDHIFFVVKNKEFKEIPCEKLKIGDNLLSFENNKLEKKEITSIKKINGNFNLIDISVNNGNFFANGLLVHNSAARFDRLTEEMAKEFHRRVSLSMKEIFFEMATLKGILIGGPGPTKEEFLRESQLPTELRKKIIAVKDIGYTNEEGLKYLVETSYEDIASAEIIKEQQILKEFFESLGKNPSKTAYGLENVRKALEHGAVQKLIISSKISKEIIKELEDKAKSISADVYYVSDETDEGLQFKNIGGVGALLRFAIN
jgi:peptide subunit release factor 1 (eRF1)